MSDFLSYQKNITSQWGEDGVIEEIFNRIGTQSKFCIEFGAWDGKHLSNTWDLWHNKGWSALLIEQNKETYYKLTDSLKEFPKAKAVNRFVRATGKDSLDQILPKYVDTNAGIDLLSIDIDSDDYYIFEGLKNFRPRVIVIEHNPTIPPQIELIQKPGEYFGCSALALDNLAKQKGYILAHMCGTNCIFVDEKDFPKLGINKKTVFDLFPYDLLTYVITSPNGSAFLSREPAYPLASIYPKHPKYISDITLIPIFLLGKKTLRSFLRIIKQKLGF
jgi:hypothetical protein